MTSLITEGNGLAAVDASGASALAWLIATLLGAAVLLLGGRRTDRVGPLGESGCPGRRSSSAWWC